jgi:predicted dehydrogenase
LIHSTDKASWALGDVPPVKAWGMGGRQVCTEPKYGDQFDHHAVVYEYANGVRVFGYCRDMLGCYSETTDVIFGTKGRAYLPNQPRIEGEKPWRYHGPTPSMYDVEHKELFEAIRAGRTINNSNYMCTSSMLAILAQTVCYTGQQITWEQAMKSELSFALPRYGWDVEPPVKPDANGQYATAMPGITQFR